MGDDSGVPVEQAELRTIIRDARRRWRVKLAVRGGAIVCGGVVLVLIASAGALEYFKFSPAALITLRVALVLAMSGLAGWFLIRPLLREASDEQVALYLEEHHPSLDASLVSAVDASGTAGRGELQRSHALVRQVVGAAIERCHQVGAPRAADRGPLRMYTTATLVVTAIAGMVLWLGPSYLRQGAWALLRVSQDVEAASPYRIDVTPGSARVARGADQTIVARLSGFTAEDVTLVSRKADESGYERLPMVPAGDGSFEVMLFDMGGDVDYFVEAAGVRSRHFTLSVLDLPYVRRIDLEYLPPAHAGLPPETVQDGGDIAVLAGSEVRLRAFTTIPAAGGRMLVDGQPVPLSREADGTLTGRFTVARDGFYRIELDTARGERVTGSPQYTIDALDDRSPSVSFSRPQRDVNATPIEEVFVEAQAQDDFGVRDLQLVYTVNGGPQKVVRLFGGAAAPTKDVSAGHTFYLEELGLEAGDFVSYFARARDNDGVGGPKSATSDLYFVRIRPFGKEFRPATSQAGGGGGGGQGDVNALSEQQRQIVTGTFNLIRDRKTLTAERFRESTVVLALSEGRLREQVSELASRVGSRLVETMPEFKRIADLLPKAVEEMRAAEEKLQARDPESAIAPAQRALVLLQKAEEEYQVQVSANRNGGGGGGGGGGNALSDDLAALFEVEMDKLANQYETRERAEQQGGSQHLDELAEKLRELARRQEQEAERERRRASAGSSGQGSGSGQRALADQAEETARRLERLAREEARPELMDAARRLQQAADAMRRAAGSGNAGASGLARSALDRLREAQDGLARGRQATAEQTLERALREAEQLAREQREIAETGRTLQQPGDPSRGVDLTPLWKRKDGLVERVAELERQLDRSANDLRTDQRETAERLQQAAGSIRENRVKEKILYSKQVMRRGTPEQAQAFENDISANLDTLRDKIADAASHVGRSGQNAATDALERARRLARGLGSLDRRTKERGQTNEGAQQNEQGDGERPAEQARGGSETGRGEEGGAGSRDDGGRAGQRGRAGGGGPGGIAGPFGGPSGVGPRPRGGFTAEDMRQFRSEIRQWAAETAELGRLLREQGVDTRELDEVRRGLQALDSDTVFRDPSELARLQAAVAERAMRFEFTLRRRSGEDSGNPSLSGADEMPEEFRALVEEYYRSLSRRPGTQ